MLFFLIVLFNCYAYHSAKNSSTAYEMKLQIPVATFILKTANGQVYNSENKTQNGAKLRVKRQQGSGAGKFTDAAKMPQVKTMRVFLQLFKNLWAPSYVGGAHPFHPDVPKPIIHLYKHKILEFFFPEIGEDAKKQ